MTGCVDECHMTYDKLQDQCLIWGATRIHPKMATNGPYGHFGQSVASENGPNGFPMPKNFGIDTKNKSLPWSEPF